MLTCVTTHDNMVQKVAHLTKCTKEHKKRCAMCISTKLKRNR